VVGVRAEAEVAPSPRLVFRLNQYSPMSIKAKPKKKRGRPATGRDPMMGFRAAPVLRASIVRWAELQPDMPGLSEATRRLVEIALKAEMPAKPAGKASNEIRAAELAAKVVDKMIDPTAPADERAQRRRRLTKGLPEFREDRVDLPKAKGK
jgi:hypothetical protein